MQGLPTTQSPTRSRSNEARIVMAVSYEWRTLVRRVTTAPVSDPSACVSLVAAAMPAGTAPTTPGFRTGRTGECERPDHIYGIRNSEFGKPNPYGGAWIGRRRTRRDLGQRFMPQTIRESPNGTTRSHNSIRSAPGDSRDCPDSSATLRVPFPKFSGSDSHQGRRQRTASSDRDQSSAAAISCLGRISHGHLRVVHGVNGHSWRGGRSQGRHAAGLGVVNP